MIIDSHTHILPPDVISDMPKFMSNDKTLYNLFHNGGKLGTADSLLDSMDQNNVDFSVVMGMGWVDQSFNSYVNDYLMESHINSGGRLVPVTGITPQHGDIGIYEAERCMSIGSHGFGEIHISEQGLAGKSFHLFEPYMKILTAENFPLVVHSSEPVGHLYPGKGQTNPQELEKLVQSFPNNKIILAHWGGGIIFYEMMKEVSKLMSNVFYDTAATPLLYKDEIFGASLNIVGAKKILFGSDYPLIDQKKILKILNNQLFSDEDRTMIYGEIAATVFKIKH